MELNRNKCGVNVWFILHCSFHLRLGPMYMESMCALQGASSISIQEGGKAYNAIIIRSIPSMRSLVFGADLRCYYKLLLLLIIHWLPCCTHDKPYTKKQCAKLSSKKMVHLTNSHREREKKLIHCPKKSGLLIFSRVFDIVILILIPYFFSSREMANFYIVCLE